MSKSLDYCICNVPEELANRPWENAKEWNSEKFYDMATDSNRHFKAIQLSTGREIDVEINFDPDAEFQGFISDGGVHEEKAIFFTSSAENCIEKITDVNKAEPDLKEDHVTYTVGNFVVLNEFKQEGFISDRKRKSKFTKFLWRSDAFIK